MGEVDASKKRTGLIPASAFNADVAQKRAEAPDLQWSANTLWELAYDEGREFRLTVVKLNDMRKPMRDSF
jgi:hypothetical protein